jgi:hypothetical protein
LFPPCFLHSGIAIQAIEIATACRCQASIYRPGTRDAGARGRGDGRPGFRRGLTRSNAVFPDEADEHDFRYLSMACRFPPGEPGIGPGGAGLGASRPCILPAQRGP